MDVFKLDRKYFDTVPEDGLIFRAKDNAFAATLPVYRAMAASIGASPEYLAHIDDLIVRVHAWRDAHRNLCKVPD